MLPKRRTRGPIVIIACLLASLVTETAAQTPGADAPPTGIQEMLSWLPSDTETVIVAHRPKVLPGLLDFRKTPELFTKEVAFGLMPLSTLGFKKGSLVQHFKDHAVVLALEGSRRFRAPKSLGLMPFEGCTLLVFADNVAERWGRYRQEALGSALKTEEIEGQGVLVFQERAESHIWTILVGFRPPIILFVATNSDYLREVLARVRGKTGPRALPVTLPEWRYVDVEAQFWGLRHFDKAHMDGDPSSPFGGPRAANWPDEQAVGLTFSFHPARGKVPVITYLSGNASLVRKTPRGPLSMGQEAEMHVSASYRQLGPDVVEASFDLKGPSGIFWMTFLLSAMLGHGVFL